jgi:iron complex transport system ATP-binding protein
LNLATSFCDQLIFLKQGRLVCQGPLDEVLQADIIHRVYGVQARVLDNAFSGSKQVSYRLSK